MLLQLLPSTEVSLLFSAASHGTGATSICAQLGQRLSFAIANAERAGTPLLPVLEEQASSAELASLAKRLAGEIVRTASLVIESLPLEWSSEDKGGERRVGRRESWEGGATNWEGRRLCGDGRGPMEEANKWLAFDPANEWARLRAMSGHSRLDGPRFDTSPVLVHLPCSFPHPSPPPSPADSTVHSAHSALGPHSSPYACTPHFSTLFSSASPHHITRPAEKAHLLRSPLLICSQTAAPSASERRPRRAIHGGARMRTWSIIYAPRIQPPSSCPRASTTSFSG